VPGAECDWSIRRSVRSTKSVGGSVLGIE